MCQFLFRCVCFICWKVFPSSSAADTFALDVQESEENFDLALIASLEIDVVPYIGDHRIPDSLVSQLGKILHAGSQACALEGESSPILLTGSSSSSPNPTSSNSASFPVSHSAKIIPVDIDEKYSDLGTTEIVRPAPRERFSYWCFDLLFLICSDTTKGQSFSFTIALFYILEPLLNRSRKS